ncbi:MAG: LptE family protein [Acidobacteria bacterium]|nr:LptE family protein [Acidobacteriota bacterium]
MWSSRSRLSPGKRLVGLLALVALTSACGYALAGRGSFLPADIRTIGIPTFTNRTAVFNVETMLTQKVRSEFIGRGKYTILPDAGSVDALLTGEVSSVTIQPASFGTDQLASRYVITMSARIELRDVRANEVLWENPSVVFRQEYEATSGASALDPAAYFGQDANALDRLSSEFARTIVSAILEAF